MAKCGTVRNVGGGAQSRVHEWRFLKEQPIIDYTYDEENKITYSRTTSKYKRVFYCVWCRKVAEDGTD